MTEKKVECPVCHGKKDLDEVTPCPTCERRGWVIEES